MQLLNPFELAAYNPLSAIPWTQAAWAGDPAWSNPGEGNAVSSWREAITANHFTASGSTRPVWSATSFSGKEGITFDGSNDALIQGGTFTTVNQAGTVVLIGQLTATSGGNNLFDGYAGSTGRWVLLKHSTRWALYGGTNIVTNTTVTRDTSPHLFACYFNGASSNIQIDGTDCALAATTIGTNSLNQLILGAETTPTTWCPCRHAFIGVYAGDVRSDAGWSGFKSWVASYYGLTIA